MWSQLRTRLDELATGLKQKNRTNLEKYIDSPHSEKINIGKVVFEVNIGAEPHGDNELAVFVDGWRHRFLGWSQSAAVGFLIDEEGRVLEMEKEVYWEHGY